MLSEVRKIKDSGKHETGFECLKSIGQNFEKQSDYEKFIELYKAF